MDNNVFLVACGFYCKVMMEKTSIVRLQMLQPGWAPVLWPAAAVRRVNLVESVLGADDRGEDRRSVRRQMCVQSECLPDVGADVLSLTLQPVEEGDQLHQLVVLLVHEPRLDWDPVLQLVAEGLHPRFPLVYLFHDIKVTANANEF